MNDTNKGFIFFLIILIFSLPVFGDMPDTGNLFLAQEPGAGETGTGDTDDESGDDVPGEFKAEQPGGFRDVELGMHIDTVKELLADDPFFDYRGEPDVSFLPEPQRSLIECPGNLFIHRAYFQFHEERLYSIIVELNQQKLDYYTMFTTLTGKYGESTSLDPSEAVWNFPQVRMSLEKPLTVKYVDKNVFHSLKESGKAEENLEAITREKFLENF
jgi:hypothetical protein